METASLVKLSVGDVIKAVVKDISKNYAILSMGGVDAYLPSTEYSWGKNCNLKNILNKGAEIQAVVVGISEQGVMLSVKRLSKDVWKTIEEYYHVGQRLKGKVINIVKFGAFVELPDGTQGLLHKNEMSFDGKKEPGEVVEEGQEIDIEVMSISKEEHRMAFSAKPFLNK